MERWSEYFQELLEYEGERTLEEDPHQNRTEIIVEPLRRDEIETNIKKLRNNRSPGENNITAEMIKYGRNDINAKIGQIIKRIWEGEIMPSTWSNAVLIPTHNIGDTTLCENYRGIALLDVVYKILATCIKTKLDEHAENIIEEYQGGFRTNRSVVDQIFTIKQIQNNCYEYKVVLYAIFVDFKQTYDKINRDKLLTAMRELGIPNKLIRLVKMTLDNTGNIVKVEGKLTDLKYATV